MTADVWGIEDGYRDAFNAWQTTSAETRSALRAAMGVADPSSAPDLAPVRLLKHGQGGHLDRPGTLRLEDGASLAVESELPVDLPSGYHDLLTGDETVRLIVAPAACFVPEGARLWGWALQLYALRSKRSWGIGDLGDLANFGRWARGQGAGLSLVNPLGAAAPTVPQEASPYYPSSRRFRNPLLLRVEEMPGYAPCRAELEPLASEARRVNADRLIKRDAIFRLKVWAFERLWKDFGTSEPFEQYCREQGRPLTEFATYCALTEAHGRDWRKWDVALRHPGLAAVARFAVERASRVRYYQWLQWLLDQQLRLAAAELPVMQDLPIGADPGGADAWSWQELLAEGVSIGAPPDIFNTLGQDWGLPPWIPHRLRAARYEPFIEVVRANLRHSAGLRIDHALGLFRLFWIPPATGPSGGAYVRYAAEELLAILAIESHRARAMIVGEDLGTVETGMQKTLAEHRVLSYRVFWFEDVPPAEYPRLSLAAISTHDLPTIAGLRSGSDLEEQRTLGLRPNEAGDAAMRARLASFAGARDSDDAAQVVTKSYEALATSASILVTASLDDVLLVEERPNLPSTTGVQRPNWSLALPVLLEDLPRSPLVAAVAQSLGKREDERSALSSADHKLEPR